MHISRRPLLGAERLPKQDDRNFPQSRQSISTQVLGRARPGLPFYRSTIAISRRRPESVFFVF